MKELSLHILDVAENGIAAGANRVRITVEEDVAGNRLRMVISDNGSGISTNQIHSVTDPFYTTRTTRRVGLGLSLLEAAARRCNGFMHVESESGAGTAVVAEFEYDHIDRAPLGDIISTLTTLIMGYPDVSFEYSHQVNNQRFEFFTDELLERFDGHLAGHPAVFKEMRQILKDGLNRLNTNKEAHGTINHQ